MFVHCLEQPTRTASLTSLLRRYRLATNGPRCRPYSVLLPVWFALPAPLPKAAVRSYRTFSPLPRPSLSLPRKRGRVGWGGGSFSVALSLRFSRLRGKHPAGRYPAPYVDGARTFLSLAGAAVRPTDLTGMGALRRKIKPYPEVRHGRACPGHPRLCFNAEGRRGCPGQALA